MYTSRNYLGPPDLMPVNRAQLKAYSCR